MSAKITVVSNGPLRLEGEFQIVDQAGAAYGLAGRQAVSLCRCGKSAKMPFCDGEHKRCSFDSPVAAFELPPPVPKP
jgi:CDGSH-type Zn-finger protein